MKIAKSKRNYLNMRCGPNPSQQCISDPNKLDGNWGQYMNEAIHDGPAVWDQQTATLVFGAGGGGYAGSNVYENHAGWAITSDWVLEPISGTPNNWGIPCKYSSGWQCAGGVLKGSTAHELGHAFGLSHPDCQSPCSIMKWHGDYPTVGFTQKEVEFLQNSPFFNLQIKGARQEATPDKPSVLERFYRFLNSLF